MREVVCGVGVKYSTKIMPVKTDMSRPQHKNYEEEVGRKRYGTINTSGKKMVGEEKISEMPKYKWKWSMSLVTANVEY